VEELVKHKSNGSGYNLIINHCPNSTFIYPLTEEELISLTKSLKGNSTAGNDDILVPENLVKQCICYAQSAKTLNERKNNQNALWQKRNNHDPKFRVVDVL
jgi:hypothetical protein